MPMPNRTHKSPAHGDVPPHSPRPSSCSETMRRTRRCLRSTSIFRLMCAVVSTLLGISLLRQHYSQATELEHLHNEETILGNCVNIEALRDKDECFESTDSRLSTPEQARITLNGDHRSQSLSDGGETKWRSSYGLVLEYDAKYDRFTALSEHDERYTTKRMLKCLIGFSMSVIWDLEFQTSLLQAYKSGTYGVKSNATVEKGKQIPSSCPSLDAESAGSMSVVINCGFDIQKDAWGNPLTEEDHDATETCVRMAWSWIKGRADMFEYSPWRDLCSEHSEGDVRCKRGVFKVESTDGVESPRNGL